MRAFGLSFSLLVAACAPAQPGETWERPVHTPPTVTETFYCRVEARREAGMIYPDRPPSDAAGTPRMQDPSRFPAELRFYEQCMTRLGFARAAVLTPVPPSR